MLGTHAQEGFFQADRHLLDFVGRDTFHGRLALMRERGELFCDEDFAELYCADNGRPSVSPALLATTLLLQCHDKVSDREAKRRADLDLGWKVALGVDLEERPFAKSTLQKFRAQLIVHEKGRAILTHSIEHARRRGLIRGKSMKLALDTTAILGRGAVRDAYNLIGDGCRLLIGALAELAGKSAAEWAEGEGCSLYVAKSLKGGTGIDWSDRGQRRRFLGRIVSDADSLLERARNALDSLPGDDERAARILSCSRLLSQILIQDVRRTPASKPDGGPPSDDEGPGKDRLALGLRDAPPDAGNAEESADPDDEAGAEIIKGGGRDRIVSVHDPQMCHGRKSASNRFAGHKAAIAADLASGVIAAVAVLPGNAPDNRDALQLVREAAENAGTGVATVVGDCAYGDGETRADFAENGYDLFARVPGRPRSSYFHKQDFVIDLDAGTCTCPAGQVTSDYRPSRQKVRAGLFHFAGQQCGPCPLKGRCIRSATKPNRRVSVHPQEELLQRARERQQRPEGRALGRSRVLVEHRLARLCQLGIRQSRFFGRLLTGFQLQMAATVANLTLAEGDSWRKKSAEPDPEPPAARAPERARQLVLQASAGRECAGENAAAATVGAVAGGRDRVGDRQCAPAARFGSDPAARSGFRVMAGTHRIGAAAMAAIARWSGAEGLWGARNGLNVPRGDFGAVANPFVTRCANRAFRPGF
ncbi:MAG: IS1182 family transposase [Chloroflexota bacterium]|nr:IS1182 family transposase [Chloroflexota bacterium]